MKKNSKLIIILLLILLLILGSTIGYHVYDAIVNNATLLTIEFYGLCGGLLFIIFLIIFQFPSKRNASYVKKLENRLNLWNTISYKVKGAGETAFNKLPIGVLIIDNNHQVVWSNTFAQEATMSDLKDKSIEEIANGILYEELLNAGKVNEDKYLVTREIFDQIYSIEILKNDKIIYLRNITEEKNTKDLYHNSTLAFGFINIDNVEESIADLDVQSKSDCKAAILSNIILWAEKFNGYVQALSDSRYILMCTLENLEKMMLEKFDILDNIKLVLKTTKAFHITLSMGIACERNISIVELTNLAQDMLELALSRGGDQVMIRLNGVNHAFGAKTDPIRKESKVEIRYKYQELESLILKSSKVFSIGHKRQDADAFASALIIYNLVQALGKESYIILDEESIDDTVKRVYSDIKLQHETILKHIITPEEALQKADANTLFLAVDFQAEAQLFDSLKGRMSTFKNIGIIDHHRKNESGTINNAKFYYSDPAASSCVELIFTLLEFSEAELVISSSEATWMMLGLVVDTNNFTYRTTSTTFEVASILNRYQANVGAVKEYLKESKDEKILRNKLLSNLEVYKDIVGIIAQKEYREVSSELISKVSDEALTITGIKLAVTLGYITKDKIKLSARSLGDVNCQVIVEKLGGGGHLTAAAAVMENVAMDDAVLRVKSAIDQVLVVAAKTKILLLEDIKAIGKKGEIIELPTHTANEYIEGSHAVLASTDNIRIFEEEKQEKAAAEEIEKQQAKDIKAKLEANPIKIYVKVGENGNLLTSINTKIIGPEIDKVAGTTIDRKKIIIDQEIDKLGSYEIIVNIDKNIEAKVILYIIEK